MALHEELYGVISVFGFIAIFYGIYLVVRHITLKQYKLYGENSKNLPYPYIELTYLLLRSMGAVIGFIFLVIGITKLIEILFHSVFLIDNYGISLITFIVMIFGTIVYVGFKMSDKLKGLKGDNHD